MSDFYPELDRSLPARIRANASYKVVRPSVDLQPNHQWGPVQVADMARGTSGYLSGPNLGKFQGRSNFGWGYTESASSETFATAILNQLGLQGPSAEPFIAPMVRYIEKGLPSHRAWSMPLEPIAESIATAMEQVDRSQDGASQLRQLATLAADIDFAGAVKEFLPKLNGRPQMVSVADIAQRTRNAQEAAMRIVSAVGKASGEYGTPAPLQAYCDGVEGALRRVYARRAEAIRFGANNRELTAAATEDFVPQGDAYMRAYEDFAREAASVVDQLDNHWSMRGGSQVSGPRAFFRNRLVQKLVVQASNKITDTFPHRHFTPEHGSQASDAVGDVLTDFRAALQRGAPDGVKVRPVHDQLMTHLGKQRALRGIAIAAREHSSAQTRLAGMETAWDQAAKDPQLAGDFAILGQDAGQTVDQISQTIDATARAQVPAQQVDLNSTVYLGG